MIPSGPQRPRDGAAGRDGTAQRDRQGGPGRPVGRRRAAGAWPGWLGLGVTTNGATTGAQMRIGVMGGTFDPIHHGHLVAASEVGHFFELDEVIFVPTGQPWQKEYRDVSEAEDRPRSEEHTSELQSLRHVV